MAYDPFGRIVEIWSLTGGVGSGYEGRIYWDGGLLAHRSSNGREYFHHKDWLGTERLRTDAQGNVVTRTQSYAFGDGASTTSTDANAAQSTANFTGQEQDDESGTVHFQFRQYSSTQGRWMSPDPYNGSYDLNNPQSLNRYSYALNNPFSLKDAKGLSTTQCYSSDDEEWCETNGGDIGGGGGTDDGYDPTDCNDPRVGCVSTTEPGPEPTPPPECSPAVCGGIVVGGINNSPSDPPTGPSTPSIEINANPAPCDPSKSHCPRTPQPGPQCIRGCHPEPFSPKPWTKSDTCALLFTVSGAAGAAAVPGVAEGEIAWWLYGTANAGVVVSIPCL